MRLAILGSGGVGGYFGGRLAASGVDVTFLARGAHLAAIRQDGLRIESAEGNLHIQPARATDDPAAVGPVDIVFFTVKLYDTDAALQMLPPLMGSQTLVVPFQNGVESVDVLARAIGPEHVAGGTCYVSAVIARPGVIKHTAMKRLIFGPLPGTPASLRLAELLAAAERAGIDATLSDHILVEIWAKFVRLTVLSGMTTVTRSPIGAIVNDADLLAMATNALEESFAVARASGVPLDDSAIPTIIASLSSMPPQTKSSMLEDLERQRPLELPFLSGALVQRGETLGVPTPTHRFIATVLKPHVGGTPGKRR
jgi:2-dehydropantoate 2-reductase